MIFLKILTLVLLLFIGQFLLLPVSDTEDHYLDGLVKDALALSEKLLYQANVKEAKNVVQMDYFEQFNSLKDRHRIPLILQNLRIQGFINTLYRIKPDPAQDPKQLLRLIPVAKNLNNNKILADLYSVLSGIYWTTGDIDPSESYGKKALDLYIKINDFEGQAIQRASLISRLHLTYFKKGEKMKILELIPKYKIEIEFSSTHSKYAMAYNTRHLAQIHLRQTHNYKKSLKWFMKSLSLREAIGFRPFIPASFSSLGDIYMKLENHEAAIKAYRKSFTLAAEINFIRYQVYPLIRTGDIYLKMKLETEARQSYVTALKVASENHYLPGIEEALEKLGINH